MDWQEFLADFSDRVLRLDKEHDVFLALLMDSRGRKSQQQIATELNITKATVKKHMNAVYALAEKEFPALTAIDGRGKLKVLRDCLRERYEGLQREEDDREFAPQPPILGQGGFIQE